MANLTGKYVAQTYTKLLQIDPDGTTSSTYVDFDLDDRLTNGLGNKIKGIVFERPATSSFSSSGIFIKRDDNTREMYFSMSGPNGFGEINFSATGSAATLYIIAERTDYSAIPGSIRMQTRGYGFDDLPVKQGDILLQTGNNSLDPVASNIILYSETQRYFIGGSLESPGSNKQPPEPPVGPTVSTLVINNTTGQLYKVSSKSFVINNPLDENKYLVHACIEGPESAVYYRGESKLINGEVEIKLPEYFESLTHEINRTVQLTPITNENGKTDLLSSSKVINGKFKVKSVLEVNLEQEFYWEVKAERKDVERFEVEPKKSDYYLNGDGPYTYLTRK